MSHKVDHSDGGYKSRKMVMAYVCLVLIALGFLGTAFWAGMATTYSEFIMGVLAAASIYTGGNTLTKWINAKHSSKKLKSSTSKPSAADAPSEKPPQA